MTEKPNKQMVVVVAVIENDGKFLIIRRVDEEPVWHHKWEMPGGKIEPGESPHEAISREVLEETGLQIADPKLLGVHTHSWHLADKTLQVFLVVYHCTASTCEVCLIPEENDAYRWVTLEEFLALDAQDVLGPNRDMILELYAPIYPTAR